MSPIVSILYLAVTIYAWLIVIRAVLSWFRPHPGTALFPVFDLLVRVTEPYLGLFRRLIPMGRIGGAGLDLSPLFGLIALFILMQVLSRL